MVENPASLAQPLEEKIFVTPKLPDVLNLNIKSVVRVEIINDEFYFKINSC